MKKGAMVVFIIMASICGFFVFDRCYNKEQDSVIDVSLGEGVILKATKTFVYTIEDIKECKLFWVARNEKEFEYYCAVFGLEMMDEVIKTDFESKEYIFIYGYQLEYLKVDQGDDRGDGYASKYAVDEKNFIPNTMYIYEIDKCGVGNPEFS